MTDHDVIIEPMNREHLAQVLAIERSSYPDPWSQNAFLKEMDSSGISVTIVARRETVVLGYIVAWIVVDEVHIGNVAIALEFRRQGLGRRMMTWLLDRAIERGCTFSTLEVRLSNIAAQMLYATLGFQPVSRRKGYYTHPVEDAIVMLKVM